MLRVAALRPLQVAQSGRLGIVYKLAVLMYVFAVVILSYREGMTLFAKGAALVLVGLFLLRAIATGERVFFPVEYRLLFGWVLLAVVSSVISRSPETALPRVLTLLQVYPIALVLSNFIVWNGDTRFYWLCIVGAAVVSGIVTLASPAQFSDFDGRIFGTLDNANAFAALLAVSIGLVLAALIGSKSVVLRVICLALAAFFIYLVARTGSRMGMLASFAAMVAVAYCFQASRKTKLVGRTAIVLIVGGAIVAGALFVLTSSEFAERYGALQTSLETGDFSSSGDTSLYGRALLYQKGFEIFLENPLLGAGLDVFRTEQLEFRTIGNNSHSNYIEILAGTGIVGGLCYFAMYYFWWARLLRCRALLRDARYIMPITSALAVALVVLVLDVAWVSYYEKLIWLILPGLIAEVSLLSGVRNGDRL